MLVELSQLQGSTLLEIFDGALPLALAKLRPQPANRARVLEGVPVHRSVDQLLDSLIANRPLEREEIGRLGTGWGACSACWRRAQASRGEGLGLTGLASVTRHRTTQPVLFALPLLPGSGGRGRRSFRYPIDATSARHRLAIPLQTCCSTQSNEISSRSSPPSSRTPVRPWPPR